MYYISGKLQMLKIYCFVIAAWNSGFECACWTRARHKHLITNVRNNNQALFFTTASPCTSQSQLGLSRLERHVYIYIRDRRAAIRPGPRQRKHKCQWGWGKVTGRVKKMVLICSLGFQEATSGAIWSPLTHEKTAVLPETSSSSEENPTWRMATLRILRLVC